MINISLRIFGFLGIVAGIALIILSVFSPIIMLLTGGIVALIGGLLLLAANKMLALLERIAQESERQKRD